MGPFSDTSVASWLDQWGYILLFFGPMLEIVFPLVPGETILVIGGYFAAQGYMHPVSAWLTGSAGAMVGISASFLLGRSLGLPLVRRWGPWLLVSETRVQWVSCWFQRMGSWSLTFGYFVPTVRHVIAFVAGTARLPWLRFGLHAYPGAMAWVLSLLLLGYFLGRPFVQLVSQYGQWVGIGFGALLVLGVAVLAVRRYAQRNKPPQDP